MTFQYSFISGVLILLALLPAGAIADTTNQNSAEVVYKFQLKLASRGQAAAQYKLGMLYETGRGIPLNVEFAREWYKRAAAQNYKPATNRLVYLDIVKDGIKDPQKAWLEDITLEARAGDGEAQFLLGQMYARGVATEQNLDNAIVLLRKASGNNISGAEEELLRVEKILAQRQAREAEQKKQAEEKQKQLREKKARDERQEKLLALEEQKKREARQKQIELDQLKKRQQAAEQQRKKLQAEKEAKAISNAKQSAPVVPDQDKLDASDICSGRNRFLPTCR